MRVVNQITFEAKDDADALRLAGERLGKDAVILSTRIVRIGGFMGFFQRKVLMVSAGIFEEDPKKEDKSRESKEKKDAQLSRELAESFQRTASFQKVLEEPGKAPRWAAQRSTISELTSSENNSAKVIYSRAGIKPDSFEADSVSLSKAGLDSVAGTLQPSAIYNGLFNGESEAFSAPSAPTAPVSDTQLLRSEVGALSQRLDQLLQHMEKSKEFSEPSVLPEKKASSAVFQPGISNVQSVSFEGVSDNQFYKKLRAADVEESLARSLLAEFALVRDVPFEKWLPSRIPCAAVGGDNPAGGRKVMFLGPTGVGKTTTIAKLAAIQALWEQKNVLLLTSDTYRIAAVDQLRTYAKILGVPIEVIFEAENFSRILNEHSNADMILLDTAGRGQRDRKNLEVFEVLYNAFNPDAVHLVLAANMKYMDMLDVVKHLPGSIKITHLVFTKLDETVSYGAVFNMVNSMNCPISYFTTGQNVPNDIEVASGEHLAELLLQGECKK